VSGFLLDTNCISEMVSPRPEARVMDWMEAADENLLYLSVLTLEEIRKGVARLPQSKRRARLETWLSEDLATALHYNLTLVLRNSGDFDGTPVALLNPWVA
jgi:predicted nucleic acid-binding protein